MAWSSKKIVGSVAGTFVVLGLIGAATNKDQTTTDHPASVAAAPVAATSPASTPALALSTPADRLVHKHAITVTGRVSASGGNAKGVRVLVNGHAATVKNGRWTRAVALQTGSNAFSVVATKGSYQEGDASFTITRHRTKAEIAQALAIHKAKVAAARQRRLQAIANRKANYIASAQSISYPQLEKDADAHAGERAVFHGQIFQVQEGYGSTIILLSVTDEGFGIWDDNIWVDYDGEIKGAEGDEITVYGTITGTKSYKTQIGGETYVPRMRAKYVIG